MEASATAVHICPPSDISPDNFPVRTAPDEYVFSFQKSSVQDPLLPASGATYSKQVSYTVFESFLNGITYSISSFVKRSPELLHQNLFPFSYIDFSLGLLPREFPLEWYHLLVQMLKLQEQKLQLVVVWLLWLRSLIKVQFGSNLFPQRISVE